MVAGLEIRGGGGGGGGGLEMKADYAELVEPKRFRPQEYRDTEGVKVPNVEVAPKGQLCSRLQVHLKRQGASQLMHAPTQTSSRRIYLSFKATPTSEGAPC